MRSDRVIGNLIGLKQGFTDQYIILHQNTFPAVLNRLARSQIANYSIFHYDGILFGHYDYMGKDFEGDMQAIADDPATRKWWQLTEPMQQPIPGKEEGEWWLPLENIFKFQRTKAKPASYLRKAFTIDNINLPPDMKGEDVFFGEILRMDVFRHLEKHYIYVEFPEDPVESTLKDIFNINPKDDRLVEMEEVFYTAGADEPRHKKVFVTGCFDLLHSGHIAFLKEASSFGDLYVGIGSDANVNNLKGRYPVNSETERKYMLDAVRHVFDCRINKGWGIMDFLQELDEIRPDLLVVNEDGHTPEKQALCERLGIEYKILKRVPHEGLPVRSTTSLRTECNIPFRIDLAGGWLDQPFVSKYYPGPVLTISIEPTQEFNDRSGMASSTRRRAIELWKTEIPAGDTEKLAKMLFSFDNPPGTVNVSGSQDALGIVLPGLNRLDYDNHYWPHSIKRILDENILTWLEGRLHLVTLGPRTGDYTVVDNSKIDENGARRLSEAADNCWNAILKMDTDGFGNYFRESFEAQVAMFPNMADSSIYRVIDQYKDKAKGWKLSGAGGGGYLIFVSEKPIPGSFRIKIRRKDRL